LLAAPLLAARLHAAPLARLPHDHRRRAGHVDDFAARAALPGFRHAQLLTEPGVLPFEPLDPVVELDDGLDARQVHALFLAEPLDLAQQRDVARRVAAAAATGALRRHQPEAVIVA